MVRIGADVLYQDSTNHPGKLVARLQDGSLIELVVAPSSDVSSLTDNTGVVSPNSTIEDVPACEGDAGGSDTVSSADAVATVASVNAALAAIENNIADLAAKVNAILTALTL